MRMASGGIKGIGALLVFYVSWINQNLTPLFWVLLGLITLDLILNAHKEGQQFAKIGSMALSLGVPSYVGSNFGNPELGKYLVAIMCLVYLQVVVPDLIKKIQAWKPSTPKQSAEQAALLALIQKVEALEAGKAEAVVRSIPNASVSVPAPDETAKG
jgi:hypothetical protein